MKDKTLLELHDDGDWYDLAREPEVARHPEWLKEFIASERDWLLCDILAANSALAEFPHDIVLWLSEMRETDEEVLVRRTLAENPAIAEFPDIIDKLAKDEGPWVRYALAHNPAVGNSGYPDLVDVR